MLRRLATLFVCFLMLTAASSAFGQATLFERKNLADWDFHVIQEGVKVADVFSFSEDGRLLCAGQPFGYLATKESYRNFKLAVEWRWPEGTRPTNSGVFVKITEQPSDSFLPKSVEIQLMNGSAGDLLTFHGRTINGSANQPATMEIPGIGKITRAQNVLAAENAPGQWNAMEILSTGGLIVVTVNGKIVNWMTGAEPVEGRVGFQSEGGPVEFRNAILTTLP